MKSKIIFSIILSAMLLTACQSDKPAETEQESQTVSSVTTASETEAAVPEKTTVTTSETTAETTATAETEPPKIENISENVTLDVHKTDISGILKDGERFSGGVQFFANNIASIGCYSDDGGEIRFFDINDLTVKASVTAPDGWDFGGGYCPCIKGGGEVLCKIPLSRFDREKLEDEYAAIIVRNDFTTEFTDGEPREILSFPAGSHNISDHPYDLFDADSGNVLAEGFKDSENHGFLSKWFYYRFAIDNDRFVYRTGGYECMPGFGYYDFTNGKAVDFPDSRDFMPIGYYDGKIYAELTAWDGMCQGELRTFDIDTLESKIFMPPNRTSGKFTEYTMSPDGSFIIANDFDGSGMNTLRIISPDSGENLVKCELNFGGSYGSQFTFIDDNSFAAQSGSELIVFDVKM